MGIFDDLNLGGRSWDEVVDILNAQAEAIQSDVDQARADGKDVITVLCDPSVERGDILTLAKLNADGETDNDNPVQARVLSVSVMTGMDNEAEELFRVGEALAVILNEGDVETLEGFLSVYGEEDDEETPEEEVEAVGDEDEDSEFCPQCGADREMCAKNQDYFGVHLNQPDFTE